MAELYLCGVLGTDMNGPARVRRAIEIIEPAMIATEGTLSTIESQVIQQARFSALPISTY